MPQPIFSWVINHKLMIIKMLSHFIKMISQFAPNQPIICIKTCDDLRHFIARNAPNRFMFYYQQHYPHNCFTTQLGTSCVFESPGLARNEPTPGQCSQGDSTPSVLSFFCEGTLTMKPFMADYAEKAQHLRRCSPHTMR